MNILIGLILPMGIMFGIMYLLLIRPQNKREAERRNTVNELAKGDKIRTFGGIVGNVTAINDGSLVIRTGSSEIEILKEAVASTIDKTETK